MRRDSWLSTGGVVINPYDGRSARDVAKSSATHDVRDFFRNLGCFLGRYELEGEALHRSETSVLRYATDISTFPNQPVALKFMQDGEALRSEIEMRVPLSSTTSAEPKCVVSMTAYHVPEGFEGFGGMVGSGGVDDGEDSHLLQPERKPRAPDQDLTEPGFGFVMVMDRMDQSWSCRPATDPLPSASRPLQVPPSTQAAARARAASSQALALRSTLWCPPRSVSRVCSISQIKWTPPRPNRGRATRRTRIRPFLPACREGARAVGVVRT